MNNFKRNNRFDSVYILNLVSDKDIITVRKGNRIAWGHWYTDFILDLMNPNGKRVWGTWDPDTKTFTIE